MIELSLPCSFERRDAPPFIAQIFTRESCNADLRHAALFAAEDDARLIFQLANGETLTFSRPSGELLSDGEVLFIDPAQARAQRWIRPNSRHNTLLITEQCDQLCQMCSQPPKKSHTDLFDYFATACRLAPLNSTIGLSGGEPTLHKERLFELLERTRLERPDLVFHVLTNAQHFTLADIPTLRALSNVFWGVPLYAAEPGLHDDIVGKPRAFEKLLDAFSILGLAGAAVELRTVLMRSNAAELPRLAELISSKLSFIDVWAIMQLECIGFAKRSWNTLFFDHSSDFSAIANACARAELHGIDVALYNFPLCTVPAAYRGLAAPSISDWKRKYYPICGACSAQSVCSGFFEWHPVEHGYRELKSI